VHPEIDNPDYVEYKDVYKYDSIAGVGIEIWQVKAGTIFDNIIVTDSVSEAEEFLAETYKAGKDKEKAMFDEIEKKKREEEENQRKKVEEEREKQDKKKKEEEEDDEDEDDEDDDKLKKKGKGHDDEL
jgi:calreticulin